MNFITILGLAMVFIYSLVKILDFLNVDKSTYGPYVLFFVLILISYIVLPKQHSIP